MIIDQDEINKLLAEADDAAEVKPPPPKPAAKRARGPLPTEVARLLRIRVPVIVRLASRRTTVQTARKLSQGTIIEFSKRVDDPLDLLINNQKIGEGVAVKSEEHFGLRVTVIESPRKRIQSLGE
ncbi:MAG: FliM/FliN family flagellar motor switch protein [Phycisphaerales bacterium]|nr:FliM/FliN family flagellar motor switch protein [Phycisphaerales bacterium]